ncbi:helix-turn-helix domain-containing protein [Pseudomonas panipatensis]|uniref:DNA-binding transcriptional regulator, XRE-family HTH domain n=1 Tax=Pseudomonas panipatensis TaxID=428992 RepID=A0A1G8M626_9PSED|nr:XRE family transcriptional regulator [Pseudomonas panipatensis]SDI62820.1 DNA-binding transcriptional regulator, XRE-family HTH domain [Pseudomonas panipatensis]SMP47771.1 transcriptional regulator, XRE family with cupin sensor [Pseudomonas panipatensis]
MSMRLKLLRKKLGVTLETLAEKTGMTKSYLSKVERGLNTPSIAAALKLAKALNVQVEELFGEENGGDPGYSLVRREQRQSLTQDDQGPAYASLARHIGGRALLPFVVYPPADFSQSTFKEHLGEEFIFVHRGRVEVDFLSERLVLETGDALHFNAQKPHRLRSLGDEQAELLVVVHSED